ncbi:hypothetical protein N9153_00005 [Planctomicrobium sp.]|nr:hypothetical protein [Planctomicrobium sp.]MDB4439280.1 hypothetical protein [Planctomicrobium sp.]
MASRRNRLASNGGSASYLLVPPYESAQTKHRFKENIEQEIAEEAEKNSALSASFCSILNAHR